MSPIISTVSQGGGDVRSTPPLPRSRLSRGQGTLGLEACLEGSLHEPRTPLQVGLALGTEASKGARCYSCTGGRSRLSPPTMRFCLACAYEALRDFAHAQASSLQEGLVKDNATLDEPGRADQGGSVAGLACTRLGFDPRVGGSPYARTRSGGYAGCYTSASLL